MEIWCAVSIAALTVSNGALLQVSGHVNADMGALSDEADGMSCDGGTGAASVRDAAFRALESSDSIRSRLVHSDSNAEEYMAASTSGMPAFRMNLSSRTGIESAMSMLWG